MHISAHHGANMNSQADLHSSATSCVCECCEPAEPAVRCYRHYTVPGRASCSTPAQQLARSQPEHYKNFRVRMKGTISSSFATLSFKLAATQRSSGTQHRPEYGAGLTTPAWLNTAIADITDAQQHGRLGQLIWLPISRCSAAGWV